MNSENLSKKVKTTHFCTLTPPYKELKSPQIAQNPCSFSLLFAIQMLIFKPTA